jgi:hypothetical protein
MRIVNAWVRVAASPKVPTDPALAAKRQDELYRTTKQWELVEPERVYTATTISFLSSGLDGYSSLSDNALDLQTPGLTADSVPNLHAFASQASHLNAPCVVSCVVCAVYR